MALQITKIDDKSDGFTVEFDVTTKYRRTFEARPSNVDQMSYARDQVAAIVPNSVVEKPEGVAVVAQPVPVTIPDAVVDLVPEPVAPAPAPTNQTPAPAPKAPAPAPTK